MNLFYIPGISDNPIRLDETESGHAVRVLRLKENDPVVVIDGKGGWFEAVIEQAHPKKCLIRIVSRRETEARPFGLHLAVAPTKNIDRFEWMLEKCTEIGVDEITPLLCRFSERKNVNLARLEKIAVAAMKQSLKATLPKINDLTPFENLVCLPFDGQKLIAHCYPGEKQHLMRLLDKNQKALILIGPEGDFSPEEVQAAQQNGFREISLGHSRLRTETAGVVACHTVSLSREAEPPAL